MLFTRQGALSQQQSPPPSLKKKKTTTNDVLTASPSPVLDPSHHPTLACSETLWIEFYEAYEE